MTQNNADLISRSALLELAHNHIGGTVDCNDIARFPAIDAEPVRHEGNTSFVSTNNLDAYADRIIVGQGTSCKVYYADEPVRHGRWQRGETNTLHKTKYYCSECGGWMYFRNGGRNGLWTRYCPNCGAKMDAEV